MKKEKEFSDSEEMAMFETLNDSELGDVEVVLKTFDKLDDNKSLDRKDKNNLSKVVKDMGQRIEKKYKVSKVKILKKLL